jgi:hypothetical protein
VPSGNDPVVVVVVVVVVTVDVGCAGDGALSPPQFTTTAHTATVELIRLT